LKKEPKKSMPEKIMLPFMLGLLCAIINFVMFFHLNFADTYVAPSTTDKAMLIHARIHLTLVKLPSVILRSYSVSDAIEKMKVNEDFIQGTIQSQLIDIIGWAIIGASIGFLINFARRRKKVLNK
jgi:hypothetical protein